ncbi:lipid-transfer protein [Nocardia ninae]|uniref:propanoyl-CoA C-acyltransferase n=1 Tax=Nocardia ninae NBRC 108245 TaxID=1210091 RepID=A0A511MQ80_9NOCA|nr:lipid-transfer protein [Nocardia ninae]GEM42641.1 putative lipid-transfer protein Ltp1/thiolase [Nocardia ninae NBRC 108245]
MTNRVFVIGVGMTKFEKPGRREGWDYPAMAKESGGKALADAGIRYEQVQEAYVGYVYGDSTSGQRAVYELGLTGLPVVNVNNNCSTGSSALYLAARAIRGGLADCALALGFEKMQSGSLEAGYTDREQPLLRHIEALAQLRDFAMPVAPWMFGAAGVEHMEQYGSTPAHFAKIAEKNHRHSADNPYAQFQDVYLLDEITSAKMVYEPLGLTRLQCSPTSDGSGAAVLAGERFVDEHGLGDRAVEIVGQAMVTDLESTFATKTARSLVGVDMSAAAARKVYEQAGIGPADLDVIELHDCFSPNELLTYEALGLCGTGEGHQLIDAGDTTYGGRWVVNPSGGLISKGHPLGATGLAQCAELTWQLRGEAQARQVGDAKVALAHNIGLGGAAIVTAYRPADR